MSVFIPKNEFYNTYKHTYEFVCKRNKPRGYAKQTEKLVSITPTLQYNFISFPQSPATKTIHCKHPEQD